MSGDPQETWRRLQQTLQNAQQQGKKFGGGGGNPRGAIGGVLGLAILGGGAVLLNNSLFNGSFSCASELSGAKAVEAPWS